MSTTDSLNLVWANKPGCSRAVAEFWIGRERLWFTLFIDDSNGSLNIEILPHLGKRGPTVLALAEVETLLEEAKLELLQ